jgi:hexosaminidase
MRRNFCFVLVAAVVAAVMGAMPLWPLPSSFSAGEATLKLHSEFKFQYVGGSLPNVVIDKAMSRYSSLIAVPEGVDGEIQACLLSVSDEVVGVIVGADESYSLAVSATGSCQISAKNTWGLLRGMETFSQLLVRSTTADKAVSLAHAPLSVADAARFGHRGVLIDTARHYLPIAEIQRVIDSLPTSKFNVLHWHTVDAESFPLSTPSEPTMVEAAFSPAMVYSMNELADMRAYANERGVEIIFELDVPGHAAAWTKGKPEVMADCFAKYYYNINDFALNPVSSSYTVLYLVAHLMLLLLLLLYRPLR